MITVTSIDDIIYSRIESMKITEDTLIGEMKRMKEFRQFRDWITGPTSLIEEIDKSRAGDINRFTCENVSYGIDTLNYIKEYVDKAPFKVVNPLKNEDTAICSFVIGKHKPFMLILPGGGYENIYPLNEGYDVARRANELGYNAFVLIYSIAERALKGRPLEDVKNALEFIFSKRDEYDISIDDYAICGFSAGGHLAATFSTKELGYKRFLLPKPSCCILGYPVITLTGPTNEQTRDNLLGINPTADDLYKYSVENYIDGDYPKTYLWQCKEDGIVPIYNSMLMDEKLTECGVKHIYKRFEGSDHGLGIGKDSQVDGWFEKAISFWQDR